MYGNAKMWKKSYILILKKIYWWVFLSEVCRSIKTSFFSLLIFLLKSKAVFVKGVSTMLWQQWVSGIEPKGKNQISTPLPTYLVCCGWLHDVPPTLFILPQLQWVANLHLASPASCRFVQICLNHCKFINSLANEVMSLPMNRIPSKTCISLQSQLSIWHH